MSHMLKDSSLIHHVFCKILDWSHLDVEWDSRASLCVLQIEFKIELCQASQQSETRDNSTQREDRAEAKTSKEETYEDAIQSWDHQCSEKWSFECDDEITRAYHNELSNTLDAALTFKVWVAWCVRRSQASVRLWSKSQYQWSTISI